MNQKLFNYLFYYYYYYFFFFLKFYEFIIYTLIKYLINIINFAICIKVVIL